ncbi:MAG: hypothetical protein A3J09_00755 [Candidatus Zambryskibacteria bacterium RIFCSPLOWO2_02_FULL_51_21]|uniref:Uncharacterized protein n=1 Tax=Candidatus Zambryskibacteria bacterium RIFCSPHIGHO2_02_FULL_43_37 TaxID=1802749 RepID=A0A1G2THF2_9BACT|nr:MAG: hypothetical protein A2723_00750 [Candidatus Zambryskibacteria bacterium RIFCSPHIGHO2_01_FULL_52_18]OHA96730.1 MAG: hypothetical protein A3D49_02715 [Candidatus Zambryskibacteria bacterium RIFCSPHIGHO2_02_FULL_43_37]OHB07424.1 MAG: hypothetical protein A2944_01790 [Candidatus Zambryskibacteria bacterium RIFCSPLOWO2_01_FULL_52_12]OHB11086.1 MAG: hypothetical protein A3J09_00755 [Candidatus Zambryskibacteria bacterium RIFCSPLOWO2_02_FULL_51_21]
MQPEIRTILTGTLLILVFGFFSYAVISHSLESPNNAFAGSWACTADVQICPDGSAVSRVPPYCQFAQCKNQ